MKAKRAMPAVAAVNATSHEVNATSHEVNATSPIPIISADVALLPEKIAGVRSLEKLYDGIHSKSPTGQATETYIT